jgi:energy-converting hydrogenase B subunit D
MIDIIQILVLIGIVITAALIVWQKDLIAAAIIFAAFSFLLSIEFYILQAPDVAIAEAAVGAALSTAIYIIAIRATEKMEVT